MADLSDVQRARLDGFVLTRGYVLAGDGIGGAGMLMMRGESNSCENCVFTLNYAQRDGLLKSNGGGIYMDGAQACTIRNCLFSSNRIESNQAGLAIYAVNVSALLIDKCRFVGEYNARNANFGVLSVNKGTGSIPPRIVNCVFSGNRVYRGTLGVLSFQVDVVNCTACCTTNTSATDGAVFWVQNNTPGPRLFNNIVTHNVSLGVWEVGTKSKPEVAYNLFHDQSRADFYDFDTTTYLTGATAIDQDVTQPERTTGNLDSSPLFVRFPTTDDGAWSAIGSFDADKVQTVLTDATGAFRPGALKGRFLNPSTSTSLHRHAEIVDNTATTITVWGDVSWAKAGDGYRIYDYRLQPDSPAINAGTATGVPPDDLAGQPRVALGGVDLGAYERQPPAGAVVIIR